MDQFPPEILGYVLPEWDTDAPQVLSLKAKVASAHFRRVGCHKELGDAGEQHRLQCPQIPGIRDYIVKIVVRIEFAGLKNDMSLAFDIRYQQLWFTGELRPYPVNRPIPI